MTRRSRRRARPTAIAALLAGALAVAALPALPAIAAALLPAAPDDAFYAIDLPPDGAPGDLLRAEELYSPAGYRLWAILYRSVGADGAPAAVSGLVLAPDAPAAAPRPIVSIAHGTTGIADACAPSRTPMQRLELTLAGQRLADRGWVVVATDYAGLGTPGIHPYLDGPTEGHNVLDALVAAQAIPEAGAGDSAVLSGVSQGGHATLWALRLAAESRPPVTIAGAVVAAPAGDLRAIAPWALGPDAGPASWRNDLYVATAWSETYGIPIDELLRPEMLPLAAEARESCTVRPPAYPLADGVTERADLVERLTANTAVGPSLAGPILYLQGDADEQIPVASARVTVDALCAAGTVVDYREYPGVNHAGSIYGGDRLDRAIDWIADRFAGLPATGTCPRG